MSSKPYVVAALVGLIVLSGLAAGAPLGSPELSLFVPDNRVKPGEETDIEVFVLNGGEITLGSSDPNANDQVTTARNVQLSMAADGVPIKIETAARPVGNVPEGVTGPVAFSISVAADARPGKYRLPVDLDYKFTRQVSDGPFDSTVHQEQDVSTTKHVTLRVERAARFEIMTANLSDLVDDTGNVTVSVRNTGTAVARDARLTVSSESDRLTFSGASSATTFVGRWDRGEVRTATFDAEVAARADDRVFPIAVDVAYEDDDGEPQASETRMSGVTVAGRKDRFAITDATADLAIGSSGPVTLTIRNAGAEPVDEARVTIRSNDPKLTFTGPTTAETFVGEWPAGETRELTFEMALDGKADPRPYSVSAVVTYRDEDRERRQTGSLVTGIVPGPEQSFAVRDLESTLRVGEEGSVRGVVINTGESAVRNAVVVFETANPNVNPVETEYQVGRLDPEARAPFSFDIGISDSAGAGPRQFNVRVRYRDADDDVRRSDPLDLNVSVAPKQDTFTVQPVNATVSAGGTASLTLRVTNVDEEVLTDISAKLFTNDPLSSSDDEAFIDRLEPGEATTITFQLSAAGGALSKVYPVDLDFQFDDADGDTQLSDTYKVPVEVTTRSTAGGPPIALLAGGIAVVGLGIGGYLWLRRR